MPVVVQLETGEPFPNVMAGNRSVIGRDHNVEITIPHPRISRHHAEIKQQGKTWLLADLNSANGTFVDDVPITEIPLDRFNTTITVRFGGKSGPALLITVIPEPDIATGGNDLIPEVRPDANDSTSQSGHIPLKPRLRIGAHPTNDVVVHGEAVADFEAEISQTPRGGHNLVALGSRQAILINDQTVTGKTTQLHPSDTITIGTWSMRYTGNALEPPDASGGYPFTVDKAAVFAGGRILLDHVSFQLKPRTVTAIVGPSGAGKSTLLGAMTGRRPADDGHVYVGDFDLYQRYEDLRTRIGLVPQSDLLHTTLKTREALEYAAALRFQRGTNPQARAQRVTEVLDILGLTNQADLVISKLSGGQRKRASVALELLTEPDLLFLDEPTSGLDPGLDRQVMKELRDLANGGRTVVVVTHSVANLDVCDDVIVLAPGGRVAYHGPPHGVLRHFGASDWSEVFDSLHSHPGQTSRATQSHLTIDPQRGRSAKIPQHVSPSWLTQFGVQARRYFSVIASDRYFLALIALLPFVLALVGSAVGTEYGLGEGPDDTGGLNLQARSLMLVMILGASFMGLSGSIQELVKERPIFEREQSIGLSTSAYLASKIAVMGLIVTLQITVFVSIALGGRDTPEEGLLLDSAFAEILLAAICLGWASMIVGLLISSLVNSSEVTMPALVLTTMVQVVLSGAVPIRYSGLLDVVGTINPGYWAMSWMGAVTDLNELAGLEDDDQGSYWDATVGNAETSLVFVAALAIVALVATRIILAVREKRV